MNALCNIAAIAAKDNMVALLPEHSRRYRGNSGVWADQAEEGDSSSNRSLPSSHLPHVGFCGCRRVLDLLAIASIRPR